MTALDGRRILVTGASRGIGAAIADAVIAAGARLAVLVRHQEQAGRGEDIVSVHASLTDPEATTAAVVQAAEALGGLDAVVNNAGTFRLGRVADGMYPDWRDMVDTNILGLLTVTKAAIPYLARSQAGQIINISSMGGRRVTSAEQGVYAATKHAVHALSVGLHQELHSLGIRVTVIAPGLVHTNLGEYITDPEIRSRAETMQRTWGLAPSDVAAQVVHVLTTPPDVHLIEIALASRRQPPPGAES